VEHVSWRGIFFINLPLAAVAVAIAIIGVPASTSGRSDDSLDLPGAVLATLGLGGVVFGLIESQRLGFAHVPVLVALAGGAVLLVSFVLWENRTGQPMLPLGLFRSSTFSGANALTLLLYAGLGGALFFFPFNLIQVQGYSATAAGAAFVPFILIMFVLSRWAGGLTARYGARLPLILGPLVAAVGFSLFTIPSVGGSYWETFFPAVVVLGLGMAVSVAPLTTAVMNAVSHDRAGIASGVNNAVSRVAGLVSVAIMGVVLLGVFRQELSSALADPSIPAAVRDAVRGSAAELGAMAISALESGPAVATARAAVEGAFVSGFRTVMWTAAALAAASAVTAALTIERREHRPVGTR
jgi:predicted MFS family arabinose efflux permease